ncbi:MAG: carbohydrate ABC transporter substrate-binding protein, CUT1 family [Ruminiclostridium sp.]|nr:carbohydrate ABC transporter substrate-binding protein, CUT1 family [Ruminiclostridium sp.]
MKKLRRSLVLALAAATVISAGSCGGGGRAETTAAEGSSADTAATTAAPATTTNPLTNETDAAVQDAAANVEVDSELKPTKKIKWLSWWDIDETSAEVELFKANYGIPEQGSKDYGEEFADRVFVYTSVPYADRYDVLGKLVASGDSPDIFEFEINYFPLSAYKAMFQSIDGVIDTYSDEWADTREAMDKFMWGGKNYTPIISEGLDSIWYYRRSVVQEAGLDDPYELYKNGEWTWDKMLEMAEKFKTSGENKYLTDGWYVQRSIVGTTGVPVVGLEDGKLKSNLNDPSIMRAMDVVSKFASQGYGYPKAENGWSLNYDWWASGNILFMVDGEWAYQNPIGGYAESNHWDEDEIFFVPAPRDPEADEYYQLFKTDPFMFCAGSDNVDGYKAWIKCNLIASKDPDIKAAAREKYKRDYNWTYEQLDFLDQLKHGDLKGVYDFRKGISTECFVDDGTSPVDKIINEPYNSYDSVYYNLVAENEGAINTAIDKMNSSLS